MLLWPFNKYPGTDYETFNWEWILKTVKEWVATMQTFKNSITAAWDAMRADWNAFESGMSEDWQGYQDNLNDQWQGYQDNLNDQWQDFIDDTYKDQITEILEDHPEWVTTVMDGAITKQKFADVLKRNINFVYDDVSDMVADDIIVGSTVLTLGYHTKNDGGGALYTIRTTPDRACSIELDNGLYAVLEGSTFTTRQIGLQSGDNGQTIINNFIADTSYSCLKIVDSIHVQKTSTASTIDVVELIKVERDNFTIIFEDDGELVLDTNNSDYYRILNIKADNITIFDPVIIGDADTIGLTTGEYGHGLYLNTCNNVTVYNGDISKCFGDGVGIYGDSNNITFLGTLVCKDCGRQGMSVIEAHQLYVEKIIGININRTDPACVVDCEPNNASESIEAEFGTICGIDCKRGFNALAHGSKTINIHNIITEHSNASYDADFGVSGTASFAGEDPEIFVHCENIYVKNSYNTCVAIANMNENMAVLVDNVTIMGSTRTVANRPDEATIRLRPAANKTARNIKIKMVNVINDTSQVSYYGICSVGTPICTLENCEINYHNQDSQVSVLSVLRNATLINTHVKTDRQPDNFYFLNSSDEVYMVTDTTVFQVEGLITNLYVMCCGLQTFKLFKTNLSGYTSNTESYINENSTRWEIVNTNICSVVFDHTNKTITFTKIA